MLIEAVGTILNQVSIILSGSVITKLSPIKTPTYKKFWKSYYNIYII